MEFEKLKEYESQYSERGLFDKLRNFAAAIGSELVYKALQLYYVLQKDEVPAKAKAVIVGALAYLISPLDLVPDMLPVVGYGDDAGVLAAALVYIAQYVDDEVREKARAAMRRFFGDEVVDRL